MVRDLTRVMATMGQNPDAPAPHVESVEEYVCSALHFLLEAAGVRVCHRRSRSHAVDHAAG